MTIEKNISQEISEELTDLAPTLSNIKRRNIFSVPNGYFEELPAKIKEQCKKGDHYKGKRIYRYINTKSIAVAASVTLVAISLLFYNIEANEKLVAIQNFTTDEIEDYLATGTIYEISEDDLINEVLNTNNDGQIDNTIEPDEIIEYLLDTDLDLTTIINEIN